MRRKFNLIGDKGRPLYLSFRASVRHKARRTRTDRFETIPGHYEQFAHAVKTYLTTKGALQQSKNYAGDHGLVLYYRPEDLEPVNISLEERRAFYREQIVKWRDRLIASGLSVDEMAVLCEEMMLEWADQMKKYERGAYVPPPLELAL